MLYQCNYWNDKKGISKLERFVEKKICIKLKVIADTIKYPYRLCSHLNKIFVGIGYFYMI